MPCNSEYMVASDYQIAVSQMACLLDELNGQKEINPSHWSGYHPRIYNKRHDADAMVRELCDKLQSVDVKNYSLEMQIWWRDHQKADKERLEREIQARKTQADKQAAIDKLTPYERKLLGG